MTTHRTRPAHPGTFNTIGNLGATLLQAGDRTAALALREGAVASALRELGPLRTHAHTI